MDVVINLCRPQLRAAVDYFAALAFFAKCDPMLHVALLKGEVSRRMPDCQQPTLQAQLPPSIKPTEQPNDPQRPN